MQPDQVVAQVVALVVTSVQFLPKGKGVAANADGALLGRREGVGRDHANKSAVAGIDLGRPAVAVAAVAARGGGKAQPVAAERAQVALARVEAGGRATYWW